MLSLLNQLEGRNPFFYRAGFIKKKCNIRISLPLSVAIPFSIGQVSSCICVLENYLYKLQRRNPFFYRAGFIT